MCVYWIGDTGNSGKAFSHFLMGSQVKNMQGDQSNSFFGFKQSENWKSPKRQAVEVSCNRPLLQMMERFVADTLFHLKNQHRAIEDSCPNRTTCGSRTGIMGSIGVNMMNTPEVVFH